MGSCQSSEVVDTPMASRASSHNVRISINKGDSFANTSATANSRSADSHEESEGLNNKHHRSNDSSLTIPSLRSSVGLDIMIDQRRAEGHLVSNIVHIEQLTGRRIEEVYDGVHNGKELGKGVAGIVRLVTHKATGTQYAVKCLDISRVKSTPETQQSLREEITIMSQLDHPNIARLQEVYEDEEQIYLVQELGSGGELFDVLDEQPEYHYAENEAVRLMLQILSALRYLHSKDIIHRDLKLENFLFSTNRHKQLKMIDFGLSKHFHAGDVQHELVGTPYTVAPEVIRGNYCEKCDIWAIGVMAFMLLSGETPFGGCGDDIPLPTLRDNILNCRYKFEPAEAWASVSQEAQDFVKAMLVCDPTQRPSAEEALRHPWIRAYHEETTRDAVLSPRVVEDLLAFKELPVTKRLMLEVVSFATRPEQIRDLRIEFEKMDIDGLGEISMECMKEVLQRASAGSSVPLSTKHIQDIFNAMKVGKTEPRVHWHEFVAACLKECQVDDSNLRIAFERLDQDHSGYVSFEDVIEIIARDADEDEDTLRSAWEESVEEYHCQQSRFSFEDFRHLVQQYV